MQVKIAKRITGEKAHSFYLCLHASSYRKYVKLKKLDSELINQVNNKKAGRVWASGDDKL